MCNFPLTLPNQGVLKLCIAEYFGGLYAGNGFLQSEVLLPSTTADIHFIFTYPGLRGQLWIFDRGKKKKRHEKKVMKGIMKLG